MRVKDIDRARDFLHDERGVVESTLVMIPLMILFLSIMQIASAVLQHNALSNQVQGDVSRAALYGATTPLIGVVRTPLPGGGSILVGHRSQRLAAISPLAVRAPEVSAAGIAVDENP
jgi:hypothetical protein